jgi:hypothetical protein
MKTRSFFVVVIDPENQTVTRTDIAKQGESELYQELRDAIGCSHVDRVKITNGIDMIVDDEGLMKEGMAGFSFTGANQTAHFAGKGVLVGVGEEDWVPVPKIDLDKLYNLIIWRTKDDMKKFIDSEFGKVVVTNF